MEKNSSFFVCLFRDEEGKQIAHASSSINNFPEELVKTIDVDQNTSESFERLFDTFCQLMLGYIDMLPTIAVAGSALSQGIRESELRRFCETNAKSSTKHLDRDIFEISVNDYSNYRSIEASDESAQLLGKQIPKMLLIGIVSGLEYHIAQLIKKVLQKFPKMISDSDKNVSVRDLFKADSLEDFKEFLLDREIESITRESFDDQVQWFEKRLSLGKSIRDDYKKMGKFG